MQTSTLLIIILSSFLTGAFSIVLLIELITYMRKVLDD